MESPCLENERGNVDPFLSSERGMLVPGKKPTRAGMAATVAAIWTFVGLGVFASATPDGPMRALGVAGTGFMAVAGIVVSMGAWRLRRGTEADT